MAVILLQAAGAALGGVFGPVGAILGQAAGALAGSLIDQSLINSTRTIRGKGLSGARIPSADEGTPVFRVHGTARIAGTLIWATRFEETVTVERRGGKGRGPKVETYSYHANFAIGLCEGPIACVRRVWADGRELDLAAVEMRVHRGTMTQLPDPLIEAKQGAAPAWRGLAYVVFERLPLDGFGNRMPMMQFEVVRPIGDLEERINAVAIIPGATEHGYATGEVSEEVGAGETRMLNRNSRQGATDWAASIDELQAVCPNLTSVALVTAWMGTDLRAGSCRFVPGVELPARGESRAWKVGNYSRETAHLVSQVNGGPIYGGTPDDLSVIEAIRDLKARGLKVVLYPFVLMDVPPGNGLPDPYGGAEQARLPWRGRITCIPAPGLAGTPDKSASIRDDITTLCGAASPADVIVGENRVDWAGAGDDGYRRMILHHAGLALAAGGVDGFLIGSELRGLTRLRDEAGGFPFVEALCGLAADVKAMLGAETTVTYGADWSEYFGYQPQDGSGDVCFNLDQLWAHPAIDAVGIDTYVPLSDWRDGDRVTGNPDGHRHANDRAAMRAMVTAGEGFDWFYASDADRAARIRTPIADGHAGKPWVFRYKDLAAWWQTLHFDRPGGTESATPSAWTPGAKPVWLTELGAPAVDKGAAQPNVFPDPRSSEGMLPHFSTGARDDDAQRAYIAATLDHWQGGGAPAGMVSPDRIYLWCWDARPYPAFPARSDLWSDGANWRGGHWLNGRLGGAPLADLIAAILTEAGFHRFDVSGVTGAVTGHAIAAVSSARALLEPLLDAFSIDVREGQTGLVFTSRTQAGGAPLVLDAVADPDDAARFEETRGEPSGLAAEAVMRFFDPAADHQPASARSRRIADAGARQEDISLPVSLDAGTAALTAERWLADHWAGRRRLSFALAPAQAAVEPGDRVEIAIAGAPTGIFRVARIEEGAVRRIEAVAQAAVPGREPASVAAPPRQTGASAAYRPDVALIDLPALTGTDDLAWARAAAVMKPWRPLILSSSTGTEGFTVRSRLDAPARMGRLMEPLAAGGREGVIDRVGRIRVRLDFGGLESVAMAAFLDGANAAAVLAANGAWEIVQFLEAQETAPSVWELTGLLRGQAGTDEAMRVGAAAASRFIMLDDAAVRPLGITAGEAGLSRNFVADPVGMAPGGAAIAFAGGARARTPLSPVHVRAKREAGGIRIGWIRRGRLDADGWPAPEIGFDEAEERYRIEVKAGEEIRRAAEVTAPQWLYPAAAEIADFGAPLSTLTVSIMQAGRHVPWGIPRPVTISL